MVNFGLPNYAYVNVRLTLRRFATILILLLTLACLMLVMNQLKAATLSEGKDPDKLTNVALFLAVNKNASTSDFRSNRESVVETIVASLKEKMNKSNNSERFLSNLFYKVHRKYLKHYRQYGDFESLLTAGQYDCVTGTAFYALLLDDLGFEYEIWETDYHIYLMVDADGQQIMMESTDPLEGFVTHSLEINTRVESYRLEGSGMSKTIDLQQLAGLMYYNLAVDSYNNQRPTEALTFLKKATSLYDAPRMGMLKRIIEDTLKSLENAPVSMR